MSYRALVVEDDPAIRRLVEKLLSRHKIDIDTAGDGRTAIDKLRTNHYSVMVLDLMVPEMNGFDVIDHIKETGNPIPVAVVSAVSQQALTKLDLDVVKVVISKPFDVDEFTKAIMTLCEESKEGHA
jgi:DNA-binding response OmpR family regulator